MRIGEVAAKAGVNRQTLLYYEREGLLPRPTRRDNGYREYPDDTVTVVRFIKRAQDLGFSLSEARVLNALRVSPRRDRARVGAVAEAKLIAVRERMVQLQAIERALADLVGECSRGRAHECAILDALTDPPSPSPQPRRHQ